MTKIIDGKQISLDIKNELKEKVAKYKEQGIEITLAVVKVGNDPASAVYVRNKEKACEYVGINSKTLALPEETTEEELLNVVKELNEDKNVNGILVQLPLPKHIDESKVLLTIDSTKDVDGFHPVNVGKMVIGEDTFLPCTPAGIIEMIKRADIDIEGKECVVIGRSNIVGKPMAMLMLKENATVTIENLNYDECVRMAAKEAAETEHGIMVQDTAWEGYEEIPTWIMQGYGTLALEADHQLEADECRPTHIFIQAGVGSLAGAVVGYFANRFKENPPIMTVVEAKAADCLFRSASKGDGSRVDVTGDMLTIMAGLACGEPNTVSWDILRNHADAFVSCPDWVSANGTRIYSSPMRGDERVISGESGSVTMGLVVAIMTTPELKELKEALKLDENSQVLLVSSEGDTDPDRYREIVWEGLCGTDKEPFADLQEN